MFFPAAHFAAGQVVLTLPLDRKGVGCADALLTMSRHLPMSLDTEMESYIVQLDFSVAFDRSHGGLLFKLKSICVVGSVLSICEEFLSNCRQRVVVDGATGEWIPIVFGAPQALFCSSFILVKCLS